jgi:hypothetical protein
VDEGSGYEDGHSDSGDASGGAPRSAQADARPRDGLWRRALLLVWGGAMIAVVLTGVVGFLVYFFLLQR